jgi:FkbM family methyltransferase
VKQIPKTDLWVPDDDTHFSALDRHGRPVALGYQHDRVVAALKYVRRRTEAIDVGAHVGLVTRKLAEEFEEVCAFEPHPETFACLGKNTAHLKCSRTGLEHVCLFQAAVGAADGRCGLDDDKTVGGNTGNRQIDTDRSDVRMVSLDGLFEAGQFNDCALLKIDVQGFEYAVITGAVKLLAAWKPVVLVELEPANKLRRTFDRPTAAAKLLGKLGYRPRRVIGADHIFVFEG